MSDLFDALARKACGVEILLEEQFLPYTNDEGQEVHVWQLDGKFIVSRYVWDRLIELQGVL